MAETGNAVAVQLVIPWWGWLSVVAVLVGIGIWVGSIQANQRAFKDFMKEVRDKLDKILEWQLSKTVTSESPLKLTKLGQTISESLDVPSLVENLFPELSERAKGKNPYDVQELCFKFIRGEYKPDAALNERMKARCRAQRAHEGLRL